MEKPIYPLNPQQLKAATHTEGPLMIFAGAGSGKTRTLTYRFAHLIRSRRAHPAEILAVTFTNKAAREMRDRIVDIAGTPRRGLFISTFHAFCLYLLRSYGKEIGLDPSFAILDASDQKRLIDSLFKELKIHTKFLTARRVLWDIQHAKAHGISSEAFTYGPYDLIGKRVSEIYDLYEKRLRDLNAMDFSDLLLNAYRLMMRSDKVLAHLRRSFRYVMVDEYQDTNFIQYQIVKQLTLQHRNLCVVGDDDQSIYSWRGANQENMRLFHEDFPEATVIKLEQNYRSTQTILRCASHLIRHNQSRTEKTLWTENEVGDPVILYEAEDEEEEAAWIIQTLLTLQKAGNRWQDFAVFYRTNAQSRILEEHLIRHGIPYRIFGGFRFYDRKEIKDLIAYLRCLVNPRDEFSARRAIAVPSRGIGKTTLDQVHSYALSHNLPYIDALGKICEEPTFRMAKKVRPFYTWLMKIRQAMDTASPSALLAMIVKETGYLDPYRNSSDPRAQSIVENVEELIAAMESYEEETEQPSVEDFLDHVTLMTDTDTLDTSAGQVTLMTLHGAKGLEFPVVFITGLEEGLFPHERSLNDEGKIDEERRLFYVGITRSRQRLFLSFCDVRNQYGRTSLRRPSRFLTELPKETLALMETSPSPAQTPRTPSSQSRDPFHAPSPHSHPDDFQVGQQVIHPTFGRGTIRVKEIKDENAKLLILFERAGLKLIYPKFVELQRL